MFNTKEELLDELNSREYTIYISELMKMITSYKSKKETVQAILNESFKLDVDFNYDSWRGLIKKKLGIKEMKKEALDGMFADTVNPIYNIINRYITVEKKAKDLELLYKQLDLNENLETEISIKKHFKFDINNAGLIQMTAPTFIGLTKEEIIAITGFWEALEFDNTDQIIKWLKQNDKCFRIGYSSNFLIKGKVVYIKIYESERMMMEDEKNGNRF